MRLPRSDNSQPQAGRRLAGLQTTPACLRWALALGWTALTGGLMLLPGPKNSPVDNVSRFFGGTDLTDAVGHIILFAVLALSWQWALSAHMAPARALKTGLGIALGLGVFTEAGQIVVPDRGANLWDLLANLGGTGVAAAFNAQARRFIKY